MRNITLLIGLGFLLSASGCASIGSAMGGNTAMTGEAWYVKTTGMGGLIFSSKVFYCPQPNTAGPAQCKEAKMVEGTK
ncbi:MAG: hypothetical protein KA258_04285 [Deltaproteobacteria bacterium]|jgi:hypothetical protein|nr:hypothetical protein [Deltaproteobacteria bacterium]